MINQEKIWDYFQGEGSKLFLGSIPRLKFLLRRARKIAGGNKLKVMNVGIGDGWLERQCVEQGWQTYSLDPSEVAVKNLEQSGATGKVGMIEAIPYDADSFDVVFCSEVLEHLSNEQLHAGLREINRVLVKNGYLIGTVPYKENMEDARTVCPDCGNVFHRFGHFQSFDKNRLRMILEAAKFEVVNLGVYAFPDFSRRTVKDQVKSLSRWVLGRLGSPIAVPILFFLVKKYE